MYFAVRSKVRWSIHADAGNERRGARHFCARNEFARVSRGAGLGLDSARNHKLINQGGHHRGELGTHAYVILWNNLSKLPDSQSCYAAPMRRGNQVLPFTAARKHSLTSALKGSRSEEHTSELQS